MVHRLEFLIMCSLSLCLLASVSIVAGFQLNPLHPAIQRPARVTIRESSIRAMELVPGDDLEEKMETEQRKKEKTKTDRFEIRFTCNVCEGANAHSISRHAYTRGTVIVVCPSCKSAHLIADNLNWIEDDFRNLEEYMERRGTPVTRVVRGGAAAAATAEAARAAGIPAASGTRVDGREGDIDRLDGITEDMAWRIRQAVRERKAKKAREDEPGE